jgi:hypothetical protein
MKCQNLFRLICASAAMQNHAFIDVIPEEALKVLQTDQTSENIQNSFRINQ